MAVYRKFAYGTEKYGPKVTSKFVAFEVTPVTAEPLGYHIMSVQWTSPIGDWQGLRVLKNYAGYAISESDGVVLLDTTSPAQSIIDDSVKPGAWHYYTIFVKSLGVWQRSGGASSLMTRDYGYGARLFNALPLHHQSTGIDDNGTPVENAHLKTYLNVLGWGLDFMKTNLTTLEGLNNPRQIHPGNLARLANQLGITYEETAPSAMFRERIANAAKLGREKGTLDQLQSLITMTTSYASYLTLSPNIMLGPDYAEFMHPLVAPYDLAVNYLAAERVIYFDRVYKCKVGGAYGPGTQPPILPENNAYWTYVSGDTAVGAADGDGAVSGWGPEGYVVGNDPTTVLATGMQSLTKPTDFTGNVLRVTNTTGAPSDLGVRSIARRTGESLLDKGQVFKFGAPLPPIYNYSETDRYLHRDLVRYQGQVYQAAMDTKGVPPLVMSDSDKWQFISADERMSIAVSVYAKEGTGAIPAYPIIEYYDEWGALLASIDTQNAPVPLFDSFGSRFGELSQRTFDSGAGAWTQVAGSWLVSDIHGGIAWPTNGVGLITAQGTADGVIALTFDEAPAGGEQYAIFRGTSAANCLKATRSSLKSVVAGVETTLGAYSTLFSDMDRMTIDFVSDAITVKRNGITVLSITSSLNQAATLHGLGVG